MKMTLTLELAMASARSAKRGARFSPSFAKVRTGSEPPLTLRLINGCWSRVTPHRPPRLAERALAIASSGVSVMFMPVVLPLKKMSRDEKLRAMEALWADLSQDEGRFESPAWHEEALRQAERAVKAGKAQFSDWEEAKRRIRRKAAKLA